VRTIEAHLVIHNEKAALVKARSCLQEHPEEPVAYELLLKSLAACHRDGEMIKLWYRFSEKFPDNAKEQEVLEQMCWGVLRKGRESSQNTTRLISLIGAALTQDMYAVDFLMSGLVSSSVQIRAIAVQLASLFKDHQLREEIERMLDEERNADVRIELIRACGELREEKLLPKMVAIVGSKKSSAIEKREAIRSVLRISDRIEKEELIDLARSKRAGLRLLACECIAKFHLTEHGELLAVLMHDPQPEVAAAAIHAIGLLKIDQLRGRPSAFYLGRLAYATNPIIGITSSWALLLQKHEIGSEALSHWLKHENRDAAAMAAAAVAKSGPFGLSLAVTMIDVVEDPYVKANLAVALIGQRKECEKACTVLATVLKEHKERWMVDDQLFGPICHSHITHKPEIPNFPEVVNQTTRLELLNLLAILEYEGAQDSIKQFLKERRWGVTGLAAEKLLGEGDESALSIVRELLDDEDQEVRLEAALALATWGRDVSALPTLMEEFEKSDRIVQHPYKQT
jgi:HEAT repeat protein